MNKHQEIVDAASIILSAVRKKQNRLTGTAPEITLALIQLDEYWVTTESKLLGELFYVFNILKADVTERYNLQTEGAKAYQPDLIVIDNVRDLMHDINDGQKSHRLVEQLMHMASENQCNVTCVIHQNRSSDNRGLRGWLGTEMINKVFEVFTSQKIAHQAGNGPMRTTRCHGDMIVLSGAPPPYILSPSSKEGRGMV